MCDLDTSTLRDRRRATDHNNISSTHKLAIMTGHFTPTLTRCDEVRINDERNDVFDLLLSK